jgi:hypothetical protein
MRGHISVWRFVQHLASWLCGATYNNARMHDIRVLTGITGWKNQYILQLLQVSPGFTCGCQCLLSGCMNELTVVILQATQA